VIPATEQIRSSEFSSCPLNNISLVHVHTSLYIEFDNVYVYLLEYSVH